jgi:glutamyl-tRNA synthetase
VLGATPVELTIVLLLEKARVSASTQIRPVVTRFAPSPTGLLHIGGARTALYNWLYAKHMGGKFLLRIEDTDRARSTEAAIDAIIDGMRWLSLDWDGDIVFQFTRANRHAEVAHAMVANGHAYRCYLTKEELADMRALADRDKRTFRIRSPWRDAPSGTGPADVPYVVRLKAPLDGDVTLNDMVQGSVTVANAELDDMILLRSDGTPTYMLSVVVDDHDMGVTHIIRGDDHLNNAFRQLVIINAMNWEVPLYAHVPLIHGPDGAKFSKRHGAQGVESYRDEMGFLPEAVNNYLLRLGWGHGDDEIIDRNQAIDWFDIADVGRAAARFDFKKLENLNGIYLRDGDDARLASLCAGRLMAKTGHTISDTGMALLIRAMPVLKVRAKTIIELAESATFLFENRPLALDDKARALLSDDGVTLLERAHDALAQSAWDLDALEACVKAVAESSEIGLGKVAQPLRAALTGRGTSPGIFDVLMLLGRAESLARIGDCLV